MQQKTALPTSRYGYHSAQDNAVFREDRVWTRECLRAGLLKDLVANGHPARKTSDLVELADSQRSSEQQWLVPTRDHN